MDREAALAKINKLLTLGNNDGATQAEAEAAMRQANKMMAAHGISMAEAMRAGQQAQFNWDDGFTAFGRDGKPTKANPIWFQWMAVAVANFTDTIAKQQYNGAQGVGIAFYGHDEDVVFALWLLDYLKDSIRRGTRDAACGSKEGREVFRKAMASGLCSRLRKLREERNADLAAASTGTALVVVNQKIAERDAHFGGANYKKSSRAVSVNADPMAAAKGWAAAQKVAINKPIGTTKVSGNLR